MWYKSKYLGALLISCLAFSSALAQPNGNYNVSESWSATLYIGNGTSITSTTYTGTQTGSLGITNGAYTQINATGLPISGLNLSRDVSYAFGTYSIDGTYPALGGGGGQNYAILQLSYFVIAIPLGQNAGFSLGNGNLSQAFSASGASFDSLSGSGIYVDGNDPDTRHKLCHHQFTVLF